MLLYVGLSIFFLFYVIQISICNNNTLPKEYQEKEVQEIKSNRISIDRDRYSKKKIPDDLDAIVIGSGIGGLSSAAFLSKTGKKVLVLEQHYIAGGCTHSFEEKGVEHETGIHYIGNIEKRKKVLDLITTDKIEWCQMGRDNYGIYDEIVINDKKYYFRTGTQNFISDMVEYFPKEKDAIHKYINLIKSVAQKDLFFNIKIIQSRWLQKLLSFLISNEYYKYVNTSAYDVIREFTNNEELIAVLCGQFGDYGPPPKKASFFVHASIVNHYLEGGYFPKGGTSVISKSIIPVIEKSGGRVLVGKAVKNIIIENNVAIGVEMENRDKIYAKNIISDAGLRNTFHKLVNPSIHKIYDNLLKNIPESTSFVYMFVNLDGEKEDLELKSSNIWVWPNNDYSKMLEDFENDPYTSPIPLFIACSCAKDDSWSERYPGKSNAIVLTIGKKEWFNQWENERCMHRGQDYNDIKESFAKRMLEEGLYNFYPKTKGKVTHYDVGTPLTNQFYLGAYNGEAYGLDSTPFRYSQATELKPKTRINGLYLTGQDICTLGFTGALMGGLLTAHSILGYGTMIDMISGRNLVNDLINLEKKIK